MKISAKILRSLNIGLASAGILLAVGFAETAAAQERDPFRKPVVAAPKSKRKSVGAPGASGATKMVKPGPAPIGAPPIQQRIENYKMLRMRAAELGLPAPKPTAVLSVSEVEVTGIFRTPRGYAAMVEATPIKLSYTIYPGEKIFDGYLVAIEDNRLVFRRETKMSDGKVLTVAENKGLKLPMLDEMLVPRVETATNQTNQPAAPAVNPTVTVPAAAVPAKTATAPVLTAENKATATESLTDNSSVSTDEKASPQPRRSNNQKPVRKVHPRKSN